MKKKMYKDDYLKNANFQIVIFKDKKLNKTLYKCMKKETAIEHWEIYKTQKPPRYVQKKCHQRFGETKYELALISRKRKNARKIYVKDKLGRSIEAELENDKYRIKKIIPYWKEELIYDHQTKKRIRYQDFLSQFTSVKQIAQIFTLNIKIFLQIDDEVKFFGNKNIEDTARLFELLKEDLLMANHTNFIFIKDVSTHQRKFIYSFLTQKGIKVEMLWKHYSR